MPIGRCHICHDRDEVRYCEACDHWFCENCRKRYFARGYEAVMEKVRFMLFGRRPGSCCGPAR